MARNLGSGLLAPMERNAEIFNGEVLPLNVRLEHIHNTAKEMAMAWKGMLEEDDYSGRWHRARKMISL